MKETILKSFKYRIYPNSKQEEILNSTLTTCRYLYNNSLEERINKYKKDKKSVSYQDQANYLSKHKNKYQVQVHSQVLQDILKRLDKSFKNFFRRIKNKEKSGFPRFKPEDRFNSFCYPQSGFKLINDNKHIELSKIGSIKIKYHRKTEGEVKTCIVKKEIDQWFVILACELRKPKIPKYSKKQETGVDVGIKSLAVLSDGTIIENPKYLKKSEEKLAKQQRKLSKKQKGSNNRNKQKVKVAKVHNKIKNQRNDNLHKVSNKLANIYSIIKFENLNIKGMLKNHKLAKSISDASWGRLIQLTTYKAEWAGGCVELVDPKYTSQDCSNCGERVPKTLAERTHRCPKCGLVMDRDENAAKNIAAKSTVGATGNKLVESRPLPSTHRRQVRTLKQEAAGIYPRK